MNLKPRKNRMFVERRPAETMTPGGIYIPDIGKERPLVGKVIAKGPGCDEFEIGDEVIFGKFTGTEFAYEGRKLVVVKPNDVQGVVEKGEA